MGTVKSGRPSWPVPGLLRLPDGRELAWYEFGDPSGTPCIYMAGTPESGLAGGCYDAAAREAGVRWISVDKPGYGHSDLKPYRSFLDWPADVSALVAHLGLERFAVAGESGGGAHALAVAYALPERVSVVALLAPMGPVDGAERFAGMRPTNVLVFRLARHAPVLLRLGSLVMRCVVLLGQRFPALAERLEAAAPEVDRRATQDRDYSIRGFAVVDAYRSGSRAAADELALFARPWGFRLSEVRTPAHIWHGTADVNVPFRIAENMARELPDVTTHFVDGAAHLVGFQARADVMDVVVEAAAGIEVGR